MKYKKYQIPLLLLKKNTPPRPLSPFLLVIRSLGVVFCTVVRRKFVDWT